MERTEGEMVEVRDEEFIVFDNLVQADSNIAGETQPVKVRKIGRDKSYAQGNASGELYRPRDLEDVGARAVRAAKTFNARFVVESGK